MDLEQVAKDLYQELPANFTAARNARAKAIASEGDRALAAGIRQFPKASASVWGLNRLAGTDAETVEEFNALGAMLRAAQQSANRPELERLIKQRKSLVAGTIKSIQGFGRDRGVQLSPSAISEIEQSLQAALADEDGAKAIFSGRLVKPIRSDGLDPVDLSGAVAGPALQSRVRRTSAPNRSSAARAKNANPKRNVALIARTQKAAESADAALKDLQQRKADLDNEHDALVRDVDALQEQFIALEKRRADLDGRDVQVDSDTVRALAASREAHRAADKARISR